ncbi:hypothetical protein FRB91_004210 [Serendipita sp. 411]|nr:hypothetical protein FRB91_004210 [Serendipita sp. 411]
MTDTIAYRILQEYQELNAEEHDVFDGPPTPIEFLRMIHISRPVLFENCPLDLRNQWTDEYLSSRVGDVQVAITPDGRADALLDHEGRTYFVEPSYETMSMRQLLRSLESEDSSEIVYLQSQNNNLGSGVAKGGEFEGIGSDLPIDVSWASEALGRQPDAVNIWIGNHKSVTSVHSDPYENIYSVARGTKIFTLYPPTEGWCLKEKHYPHAQWHRDQDGRLKLEVSPGKTVRWSSVQDATEPLPPARSITVIVREGQMLYLPPGWWHYVQQLPDKHGKVIAVNYWYDMEMKGHHWVFLSLLRSLGSPEGDVNQSCIEEGQRI